MKKLGLLIVGAFLLTACDATPKGNKSIMPVEHDEAMEHVDHHDGHGAHDGNAEELDHSIHETPAIKDSAENDAELPVTERKNPEEVDESPENAAH